MQFKLARRFIANNHSAMAFCAKCEDIFPIPPVIELVAITCCGRGCRGCSGRALSGLYEASHGSHAARRHEEGVEGLAGRDATAGGSRAQISLATSCTTLILSRTLAVTANFPEKNYRERVS